MHHISLNSRVQCTDGRGGHLTCVIITPTSRHLTHVVVEEANAPFLKRLVPLELITTSTSAEIQLDCTIRQLASLQPVVELEPLDGNGLHLQYAAKVYRQWPQNAYGQLPIPAELEQLAPEAVKIHKHNHVKTSTSQAGAAIDFLVNDATKQILALVIQWKWWWKTHTAQVPVSQVDHFEPDLVVLKLDKHSLQNTAISQFQQQTV